MKSPWQTWNHSRPRAAVFSVSPFPSPRAHVGAIIGMTNALQSHGYVTRLYAFFRTGAHETLVSQFGLHKSVGFGWSAKIPTRVGMLLSVVSWVLVAAVRSHDVILTRSPLIALAARRCDRVLLEIHQEPANRLGRAKLDYWIIPLLRGKRYKFVYISRAIRTHYLKEFPSLSCARCVVAPSGFRRDWFPNSWSPSPRNRIVTYAGSLYQGRGIEVVLEVARRIPDAVFRVIGGTSQAWVDLTSDIHVPGNCSHISHIAPTAIAGFLAESDVLLAPYQYKVLTASGDDIAGVISPLKLMEYFAAGRAVVASDLPAIREIAEHSGNALLVPPKDVAAWTKAVEELLSNHTSRDRLSQRAFNSAHARLDWDSRLEAILRPSG